MRHAPTKDDIQMVNFLIDYGIPFVIVFTKADKLKKTAREERLKAFEQEIPCFEDITCVPFSTVTGEGVEEIRRIIEDISENAEMYEPDYEELEKRRIILPVTAIRDFLLREAGINKIIKNPLLLQGNVLNYNYNLGKMSPTTKVAGNIL